MQAGCRGDMQTHAHKSTRLPLTASCHSETPTSTKASTAAMKRQASEMSSVMIYEKCAILREERATGIVSVSWQGEVSGTCLIVVKGLRMPFADR